MGDKRGIGDRRGFALVTVLWFLAVFFVAATGMSFLNTVEVKASFYMEEKARAYYLAREGLARSAAELSMLWARRRAWEARADGTWRTWQGQGGGGRVAVLNERGKLNFNRSRPLVVRQTLERAGLDPEEAMALSDAVMDWIDGDDLKRNAGAERAYYASLNPPYEPRNGPIQSLGELLALRGFDGGLVLGLGPGAEIRPDLPAGGVWSLFTVYDPGFKVDVNSASPLVLRSLPGMDEETAARLIEEREIRPLRSLATVRTIVGENRFRRLAPFVTVSPGRIYTIISEGWVSGGKGRHAVMAIINIQPRGRIEQLYWIDDLFYSWPRGGEDADAGQEG